MNTAVANISAQIHSSGPLTMSSRHSSGINSPAYSNPTPDAATAAANAALGNKNAGARNAGDEIVNGNGNPNSFNNSPNGGNRVHSGSINSVGSSIWTGRDSQIMTGTGVGANMRTMGSSSFRNKASQLGDRSSPIRAGGSIGLIGARRR